MNLKMVLKICTDVIMTVLLLLLMAFNIVGPKLHEWFGIAIFIVFIVHNVLNYRWYSNILKGKYSAYRVLQTIVNISIFVTMICSMISGIMMSRYIFDFLSIKGNMSLARSIHMSASYLGFTLISIHLGLHWNIIINMFKKITKVEKHNYLTAAIKVIGILIAGYGAYVFKKNEILSNILLVNKFAYFGSYESVVFFFIDYLAMMGFWICVSHYTVKLLQRNRKRKKLSDNK